MLVMIKMKKLLTFMVLGIVFLSLASATVQTLGTFKQGSEVELIQSCADCSYINITSVIYPNSSRALGEVQMVQEGSLWTYSFSNTEELGKYIVCGIGDLEGVNTVWCYDFYISSTGKTESIFTGLVSTIFFISILAITFLFFILGFKFSDYNGMGAVALFFYGIGFLFVLYSLFLGYVFAGELGMINQAGLQLTMFKIVGTFIGLLIIGFVIYSLYLAIRAWDFKKNTLNNDDGWDNGLFDSKY